MPEPNESPDSVPHPYVWLRPWLRLPPMGTSAKTEQEACMGKYMEVGHSLVTAQMFLLAPYLQPEQHAACCRVREVPATWHCKEVAMLLPLNGNSRGMMPAHGSDTW